MLATRSVWPWALAAPCALILADCRQATELTVIVTTDLDGSLWSG